MVDQHVYRMNEARKHWLQVYVESGDAHKATKTAYPDLKGQSIYSKTGTLKAELSEDIDKASRDLYGKEAPLMMNVIKNIAINGKQEAVKLKAADTWLSRAGHDAAQVLEVKETATHEQLLQRLKIATQGIDKSLLVAALPEELLNQLEGQDNERRKETEH